MEIINGVEQGGGGGGGAVAAITSGTINGAVIGGVVPTTGTFGALSADSISDLDLLALYDSDDSNSLTVTWDENDTVNRTLKLKVSTGSRVLTMTGDATIADWFDQGVKVADSPAFANLNLGTGELTAGSINRASGALTLEIGGTSELSITTTTSTFGGNIIIPDGGGIGSVTDTDAISIASGGDVTFTQDIIMSGGKTIGQAAGPLMAFDDSNNYLEITGCNVGIATTTPGVRLSITGADLATSGIVASLWGSESGRQSTMQYTDGFTYNFAAGADSSGDFGFWSGRSISVAGTLRMIIEQGGNVGIGTGAPGNPLAVNRSADGVIIDLESADTVEGTISITTDTVSYNAFVGSHYTQLKNGQVEPPLGAVMVSTGEIIPCTKSTESEIEVTAQNAIILVAKTNALEMISIEVEDVTNIISKTTKYSYDPETDVETPKVTTIYGTKTVQKRKLKEGIYYHEKTRKFFKLKTDVEKREGKFYKKIQGTENVPGKEYFSYVAPTVIAGDKRVYGTWMGKMSDSSFGMSFGDLNKPVYLVSQVGLYKIRVTDTNGNIANGDYLETSTRQYEAQKQPLSERQNSTIGKAMNDVDWALETTDPVLGYKWKLIPITF